MGSRWRGHTRPKCRSQSDSRSEGSSGRRGQKILVTKRLDSASRTSRASTTRLASIVSFIADALGPELDRAPLTVLASAE